MNGLLSEVITWFGQPGRWSFTESIGVPYRVVEHLHVSIVAIIIAIAIAVPPALALSHARRAEALASSIVNIGRAIPSFGLIVFFWLLASRTQIVGTTFWPLVFALVALALPPIFTNTYTAVREVDATAVESARGMGYTERQVLRHIELPLASPVMLAGIRLAFIQVVATTAIGAIVTNGGGLGRYIVDGFATGRSGWPAVVAGALLLGLLTLVCEGLFALAERWVTPVGVRHDGARAKAKAASRAGAAG